MSGGANTEHDVAITNRRGQRLAATVTEPSAPRATAAVLLIHGLGGHRNEPHIVAVADGIAARGLRVLRVDLANNAGESDGDFRDLTLSGEVDDAEDALASLIAMSGSEMQIGAAGHSFGGLVCMLLAARRSEVRSLVLMSSVFDAPSRFRANFADRETEWRQCGEIEFGGGRRLGVAFLDDLSNWDVREHARRVTSPVLLIHGDEDTEVPPSETLEYKRHLGSKSVDVRMVRGADHTYTRDAWRRDVAEAAAEWFEATLV